MISTILPRPIAWVSTISADGKNNLAPFSFFQGITANPPTVMFSAVNKRDGARKDTVRNLEEVGEFVVNFVPRRLGEAMSATSAMLPHGESEFERFGIASMPASVVRPRRVEGSPVAFECRVQSIVRIGEGPLAANVVFGNLLLAHVDDTVVAPDGLPDPERLDLIGRLGRDSYTGTSDHFEIQRP
jgi:flavin reductase (DIM6/NTAB) family NADH-FMN oxidoreductase RutF